MGGTKDFLNLIRVRQWYKNLEIFLAIFFFGEMFVLDKFFLIVVGFFALCFISSSSYIINDLVDLKSDQRNPEKQSRPLAAGRISKRVAVLLVIFLLILSLYLASYLGILFLYIILIMFLLTQLYTFFLKKIVFADILAIAILFVLRAVSGALILNIGVSAWLILCPFFLSLFLSVGKRRAELSLLKEEAQVARKTLKDYSLNLTNSLMIISTTLLMISYTLYSFLSNYQNLLYTLPFALFVIFRFFYLIDSGSVIARHPEKVIKDKEMVVGIVLWVVMTFFIVYFNFF